MAFSSLLSFCMFSVLLHIFPCLPVFIFSFLSPSLSPFVTFCSYFVFAIPFVFLCCNLPFLYFFSIPTSFYRIFISFLSFCFFLFQSYFLIFLSLIFLFYFLYPGILSFSCVRHTCTCARVPVHSRHTVCHAQHAPILLRTEPFELARLNLASGAARNNRNFSS